MDDHNKRVMLFGTAAQPSARTELMAGPIRAVLEDGNLRHIRIGGREAIRAISYVVRDRDWGTYTPRLSDLRIESAAERFVVTYSATCGDETQELRYRARIEGSASGLSFSVTGEAVSDFTTSRAGFVVLHPIAGVAGEPAEVLHVNGRVEHARFPALIEPYQPFMDIRALTHEVAPGVRVTCRMEGDTFEMEDQRNWTDASYKTYVRPLGLPWPFVIRDGETTEQRVTLSVQGGLPVAPASDKTIELILGRSAGRLPGIGIGLDPSRPVPDAVLPFLVALGPSHLRCRFDPLRGHDTETMRSFQSLAERTGAALALEAVLPSRGDLEAEAAAIARAAQEAGACFAAVIVSPAPDLKGTLPGSQWPECPPLDHVYAAMRKVFPHARLGGGQYCFFTELNRKRPPVSPLDFITYTTCATVHAADDLSVMETLECLPTVMASAGSIAGGRGQWVGPSAIGLPANPYGAAPADNAENGRKAMARMDPRQRGLLGAAWALGYLARCTEGGVEAVTLSAPVGEFGLIHVPMPYPQPMYDGTGGLYPTYHVLRGLSRASGRISRLLVSSRPQQVLGLAFEADGGLEVWVANLTGEACSVRPGFGGRAAMLDTGSFRAAQSNADFLDHPTGAVAQGESLPLQPYAVCRILA